MRAATGAATPFTGLGRRAYNRESDLDQKMPAGIGRPIHAAGYGANKTATMRAHLREHGHAGGAHLAMLANVKSTSLVYALLKNDIKAGRIQYACGAYRWNEAADQQLANRLCEAAALLRQHGYLVTKTDA